MAEIKDVVIEDQDAQTDSVVTTSANLPSEPFPGYAVNYPTCSEQLRLASYGEASKPDGLSGIRNQMESLESSE